MKHRLPALHFDPHALMPFLGHETLELHHGKHHRGYVDKLNALTQSGEFADADLVDIVKRGEGAVFDNAAQHFNHSFYWRCITPGERSQPGGKLLEAIQRDFGSVEKLRETFTNEAKTLFGSGWCWLTKDADWNLKVRATSNAGTPITDGESPLLTCDVWEHAYYVDYRNERPKYVDAFWEAVDWSFVELCHERPEIVAEEILGLAGQRS